MPANRGDGYHLGTSHQTIGSPRPSIKTESQCRTPCRNLVLSHEFRDLSLRSGNPPCARWDERDTVVLLAVQHLPRPTVVEGGVRPRTNQPAPLAADRGRMPVADQVRRYGGTHHVAHPRGREPGAASVR